MLLETERLFIRNFKEDDFLDLYEYLSDNDVVKYEPYNPYTFEEAVEEAKIRSKDPNFLAVCLKDSHKVIGNIFLMRQECDGYCLGYVFNKKFQNKGYAYESVGKIVEYAFEKMNAHRIFAMCNPENFRSWHLLEKLKMRREGHLKANIYFKKNENNEPIWLDTYEYAILKTEWKKEAIC